MNSISTICICGVIVIQTLAFGQFAEITRLKNAVNSVTNNLTQYKINLESYFYMQLRNIEFNAGSHMRRRVQLALSDDEDAVAAAKIVESNTEHCYKLLRQRSINNASEAYSVLDKCIDIQLNRLKPVVQLIELHLDGEHSLLSKLHRVTIHCASEDIMQTQRCVARKIRQVSLSVRNFVKDQQV